MKVVSLLCVLFLGFGAALMVLYLSCWTFDSSTSGMVSTRVGEEGLFVRAARRKLKEIRYNPSSNKKTETSYVNLDDYHKIDPAPSSKASIKHGPIEHGTPMNPFIPRPSPPGHPRHAGVP